MGIDLTGFGSVADFAKGVMDRFWPPKMDEGEKAKIQLQLQDMLERRENTVIETQKSIIVAEMQQSDNFTKRARPSIVYFGLAAIGLVHVALPVLAWAALTFSGKPLDAMPQIALPGEFWTTWGGVCGIWVIGRSAEKRGMTGKIVSAITGSKP